MTLLSLVLAFAPYPGSKPRDDQRDDPRKTSYLVGGAQLSYTGPPLPKVYTVNFGVDGYGIDCSAVLLHPKWVLSAAHCEKYLFEYRMPCSATFNPAADGWEASDKCCMANTDYAETRAEQVAGTAPLTPSTAVGHPHPGEMRWSSEGLLEACTNDCDTPSTFPADCLAENPEYTGSCMNFWTASTCSPGTSGCSPGDCRYWEVCPMLAGRGARCTQARTGVGTAADACPICCAAGVEKLTVGACRNDPVCTVVTPNCGEITAALTGRAQVAEIDRDATDESACHASMAYTGYPRLPPYHPGFASFGWEKARDDISLRELATPYTPPSQCAAPDGVKYDLQPMEFSLPDKCDDYRGWTWWIAGYGLQTRDGTYLNKDIRFSQANWVVDRIERNPSFTFDDSTWGFTKTSGDIEVDTDAITHAGYDDAFKIAKTKGLTDVAAHTFAFEASVGRDDGPIAVYDPASLTAGNADGTNTGDSGSSLIGTPPGCAPWGTGVADDGTTCRSVTVGTLFGGGAGKTLLLTDGEHYNCASEEECAENIRNANKVDVGKVSAFGSVHKAKPWIVETIGEGLKTRKCYGVGNEEWTKPLTTAGDRCYCEFHTDQEGLNACPAELCATYVETCFDATGSEPWKDSDGYDCAEYTARSWCPRFEDYGTQAIKAKEACCDCGGGSQSASGVCVDAMASESWKDSDGYDCNVYEQNSWCPTWQNYGTQAIKPKDACCVCGGGQATPSCLDLAEQPWTDSDGYGCDVYEQMAWCPRWQNYGTQAIKPKDACCVCGGGQTTDSGCVDTQLPWEDSTGADCAEYKARSWCPRFEDYGTQAIKPKEACCECGGGTFVPADDDVELSAPP